MITDNIMVQIGTLLILLISHMTGVGVTIDGISKNDEILDINQNNGYYRVIRIVDGDTFDIENGERVRMIGIDTPERGENYYLEAKDHLATLIGDKMVYLAKDISERDRYERLLRHVYIDDIWINELMVRDGFAHVVTFPPDVMHVDVFREAEADARKNERGLWRK
jgi:micrococcal nuclease